MRYSARSAWQQIGRFYLWLILATGVPSVALSLSLSTSRIAAAWLQAIVALPVITAGVLLVWSLTVYPLLLVLAVIFGRGSNPTGCNPNGPGIVICPLSVSRSRGMQPNTRCSQRGPAVRGTELVGW